jgi:hypothetical protein
MCDAACGRLPGAGRAGGHGRAPEAPGGPGPGPAGLRRGAARRCAACSLRARIALLDAPIRAWVRAARTARPRRAARARAIAGSCVHAAGPDVVSATLGCSISPGATVLHIAGRLRQCAPHRRASALLCSKSPRVCATGACPRTRGRCPPRSEGDADGEHKTVKTRRGGQDGEGCRP